MKRPVDRLEFLSALESVRWIGLMSGTSGDGIDAALVEVSGRGRVADVRVLGTISAAFPDSFRNELRETLRLPPSVEVAATWDAKLAERFAAAAMALMERFGAADAIALSGHTFAHLPRAEPPTTLQLGSPQKVATVTGLPVVSGFRADDVARGGEGAPLVPAADRILFARKGVDVLVLNIGGITNLTWLPADGSDPHATDCGPGNLILDELVLRHSGGKSRFDVDGELARQGRVVAELVEQWCDHPFFHDASWRSTGREQFGSAWVDRHMAGMEAHSINDRLATVAAWISRAVGLTCRRWGLRVASAELLVGGGGGHNLALMEALQVELGVSPRVLRSGVDAVDGDDREAVCFALLGHLYLQGAAASFPTTTGCRFPGPLGGIQFPPTESHPAF